MIHVKQYIAEQFINKTFHFKCDCLVPLDIVGLVKDYNISNSEIILLVSVNNKIIHIGLNTPSLQIEPA
jgi:hypothetical protein